MLRFPSVGVAGGHNKSEEFMERRLPSPTLVIACLALFVSLTGSGIAAGHYLITSTKQIHPSVIKKLKGATGPAGARGSQGPAGTAGVAGAAGARGPSGLSGLVTVTSIPVDLDPGYYVAPTATCPAGTSVIGTGSYGGVDWASVAWVKSYGTFVGGEINNFAATTAPGVYIQAICATVSATGSGLSVSKQDQLQQFKADVTAATTNRQLKIAR